MKFFQKNRRSRIIERDILIVGSGDHTEAIQIDYDPTKTDYKAMLDVFWTEHDPTAKYKAQYKSAIYYHSPEQESLAKETKAEHQKKLSRPIVTDIEKLDRFYDAEE